MSPSLPNSTWKVAFWQKLNDSIFECNEDGEPKLAAKLFPTEDPLSNFANFAAYIYNYYRENVPADILQQYAEYTLFELSQREDAKHLLKTSTIPWRQTESGGYIPDINNEQSKTLPQAVNWVGFYYLREYEVSSEIDVEKKFQHSATNNDLLSKSMLFLGPFCGKPAVTAIPIGKGVCGESMAQTVANYKEYRHYCVAKAQGRMHPAGVYSRTLAQLASIVPNVHDHPNHLACDAASNSEIVIPIVITPPIWNEHAKVVKKHNINANLDQVGDEAERLEGEALQKVYNDITTVLLGLLDIDSPYLNMFTEQDAHALSTALWLLLTQSQGSHDVIKQKHVGYGKLLTFLENKDDLACKAHD